MKNLVALICEEDDDRIQKPDECKRREEREEFVVQKLLAGNEPNEVPRGEARNKRDTEILSGR